MTDQDKKKIQEAIREIDSTLSYNPADNLTTYGEALKTLVKSAQSLLSGEDDLTAAYMCGFEKGKDSVKAGENENELKILRREIMTKFAEELGLLINRHSKENDSNTPDYILAQYLQGCLSVFNVAVQQRENWYRRDPRPTLEK